MKWRTEALEVDPLFDFSNCSRIISLHLDESEADRVHMHVEFAYSSDRQKGRMRFRFMSVSRVEMNFSDELMFTPDFFVSYDETVPEYCAFDELSHCIRWFCKDIQFMGFEPGDVVLI